MLVGVCLVCMFDVVCLVEPSLAFIMCVCWFVCLLFCLVCWFFGCRFIHVLLLFVLFVVLYVGWLMCLSVCVWCICVLVKVLVILVLVYSCLLWLFDVLIAHSFVGSFACSDVRVSVHLSSCCLFVFV